jgi:broad specificity phosphatase PhoE/predicted kinase
MELTTETALAKAKPGKPRTGRNYDNNVPWLLNTIGGRPTVVTMVGLPARGKTLVSEKLCRYLNWNKITSKVFHVSKYRRICADEFPEHNITEPIAVEESALRQKCIDLAMTDIKEYFTNPQLHGEIAIWDATNSTRQWRQEWIDFCGSNGYDLFFIETLTDNKKIIQMYLVGIEVEHPEYAGLTHEQAVDKFEFHMREYGKTYEPLDAEVEVEKNISFLKIFDAGQQFLVHNMQGFLQSKIVYYLMNIRFFKRHIYLVRHGESANNVCGRLGGDTYLSPRGIRFAHALAEYFNGLNMPDLQVWTSHLRRAMQTAGRINAPILCWNALKEIDVGDFDGLTYEEIAEQFPYEFKRREEDKYNYRYPDGESYDDLVTRLEPVMMEIERTGNLVIICHQAVMRCILAYFLADYTLDDIPYIEVPLHVVVKLTPLACACKMEKIPFDVPAVSTQRNKIKIESRAATFTN